MSLEYGIVIVTASSSLNPLPGHDDLGEAMTRQDINGWAQQPGLTLIFSNAAKEGALNVVLTNGGSR